MVGRATNWTSSGDGIVPQPRWNYLALLLLPTATILSNGVFIMAVRHSRCFSSPTSHYMVSLAFSQILIALIDEIPTMVVYIRGLASSSGCFYLMTLDLFSVTISAMHFLAIVWHRLAETKYFQFLARCHLKLPAFVCPWSLTILVTIAAITDFSIVHGALRNTDGNPVCALNVEECWIWIVPLCLHVIVIATTLGLCINSRRAKNNANGISIVNRCSGDWTKSMALVFIDPNDLLYAEEGDNYVVADGEIDPAGNHIEYTGLTVSNSNADICDAILERDSSPSCPAPRETTAGHDGKTFQTTIEEEILEPDTNALLLNDAVLPSQLTHHRPPPSHASLGHVIRSTCVAEVVTLIEALYVFPQLPYVIVNTIFCAVGAVLVDTLVMRSFKWLAMLPGLVVPVVHMCMMPSMYKNLIADKARRVALTIGQFNRYHRT